MSASSGGATKPGAQGRFATTQWSLVLAAGERGKAGAEEALAPAARDESAPLRVLLEKQLELIRGLSGRIEEARERRSRRIEMLKTLALHLASLRARSAPTPTELCSLSERVRALCDDIGRQSMALSEAPAEGALGIDDLATLDRTPK